MLKPQLSVLVFSSTMSRHQCMGLEGGGGGPIVQVVLVAVLGRLHLVTAAAVTITALCVGVLGDGAQDPQHQLGMGGLGLQHRHSLRTGRRLRQSRPPAMVMPRDSRGSFFRLTVFSWLEKPPGGREPNPPQRDSKDVLGRRKLTVTSFDPPPPKETNLSSNSNSNSNNNNNNKLPAAWRCGVVLPYHTDIEKDEDRFYHSPSFPSCRRFDVRSITFRKVEWRLKYCGSGALRAAQPDLPSPPPPSASSWASVDLITTKFTRTSLA
ncbi:hypothetical protein CRUP_029128 [Coryphaenoides rupestris]|nr:hypothetical protein CRUP_029128 [Coryphaenoides rupestris]